MSLLAAVVLSASVDARVEDVRLLSIDSRPAIRMRLTAAPGRVAVYRDGGLTRVSLEQADLGLAFSGSDRFQWVQPAAEMTAAARGLNLETLWIQRGRGEVSLLLRLPPEVAVEVRRERSVVILVFREPPPPTGIRMAAADSALFAPPASATPRPESVAPMAAPAAAPVAAPSPAPLPPPVAATTPPPVAAPTPAPLPPPVAATPVAAATPDPTPTTPSTEITAPTVIVPAHDRPGEAVAAADSGATPTGEVLTPLSPEAGAQLLGTLSSSPPGALPAPVPLAGLAPEGAEGTEAASSEDLYKRLFPEGQPVADSVSAQEELSRMEAPHQGRTLQLGFLTFRPSLRLGYVNSQSNVLTDASTAKDRYFQIQPGLGAAATLWDGRFRAEYEPIFRGFGSYPVTEATTHRVGARLDVPVGERLKLDANDTYVTGVLEANEVDPGGEYFFDLSRFNRNTFAANASYEVAPRWRAKGGGSLNRVRFKDPGNFFDYDQRSLMAGVAFDLTPRREATLAYVYDQVPRPDQHPEAAETAHGAQLTLSGEVTPLMTGQVTVGYRHQENSLAGEGGQQYDGLVASGSVTRAFGRRAALTLGGGHTPLPSGFEQNGFYVSSEVLGSLAVPLPYSFTLDGGAGYRWNNYRTVSAEIGEPREDTIFGWRVGLRRSLGPGGSVGVGYQRQRRRSNLDQFDTTTDGLLLQLEFNVFSAAGFR